MWHAQAAELSRHYRVLRYDNRGHGMSSAPSAAYSIDDLGTDALMLLDALHIGRTHVCGLSIGGLTAQWLGLNAGERLGRIVVCATAPRIGSAESWNARIALVREKGLGALTEATAERWFTPAFRSAHPETVEAVLNSFTATSIDGYLGCCTALADCDLTNDIAAITNPLLAISGKDDPVSPPADLEQIALGVRQGCHVSLPGRHIVNIESASAFNARLHAFLAGGL